jgi:hypothetical protein
MQRPGHHLVATVLGLALTGVAWNFALACACCTNTGERTDLVMPLNSGHMDEIAKLRFDKTATLFLGEADPESVKGITSPASRYALQVSWIRDRLVFTFGDGSPPAGMLVLTRPRNLTIFATDTREAPKSNLGPVLYKEWRLTSMAIGTGNFVPGAGPGQTLTLVLQGRGNNCTSSIDFTHWMLKMWGPKAKYHFFGSLQP